MTVDLHVHTTASDGQDTPQQVVALAKEKGLKAVAITDHDTLAGIGPATVAGNLLGLEVVPGVELSTVCGNDEVHILGYLMNMQHPEFLEHLNTFKRARVDRAEKIVQRLQELTINLTMDRVLDLAGNGAVGRPHIARALVEMGVVNSVAGAFDELLGSGKPAFVPRFKLTPVQAVQLIANAGGVPVFAHPGLVKHDAMVAKLVEVGLRGLEVYHPDHSAAMSRHYLALCRQYNLLVTGGSDYHGPGINNHSNLGQSTVTYEVVQEMKRLVGVQV
jgi:predicted metal-dependent phosphoesterase TrpH